ncbi:hypothetical protein [Botrimarina mediterranea]|uniref:Uncharacterized protein n=1 Tax=Botrimarina mediterranea TaxID=2528022 RepID=A0A518K369_9BACT|nr:hypothetical protein [Botrimarina mediterranea]QDV72219.1 hypothetical protein Spa11_03910 [Botrimarina mediterranea]QDV76763.1 hypothetical protein K2D_03440 [Planctomycetes bacterium K2D]
MANVPLAKVKALCTAAEYDLVQASRRPQIGQHDAAALKQHVAKARKLRDKWRDQATKQRRDTQQRHNARVADGEKRSEQKVEVFDAALAAFEKQLAKVSASGGGSSKAAPKKKSTKSARTPDHRADRASKRATLEAQREELNAATAKKKSAKKKTAKKIAASDAVKKKPSKKKVAKKKVAKKKAAKKGAYAARAKKAVKKKLEKSVSSTAVDGGAPSTESGPVGPVNKKTQRRAKTVAKQERIDRSGLNSRVRGHVSARERRAQGRRDSRSDARK